MNPDIAELLLKWEMRAVSAETLRFHTEGAYTNRDLCEVIADTVRRCADELAELP